MLVTIVMLISVVTLATIVTLATVIILQFSVNILFCYKFSLTPTVNCYTDILDILYVKCLQNCISNLLFQ